MKKSNYLICFFLAAALYCDAQSAIPDPEFLGEVEYYDKANNKLVRLEKTIAKSENKTRNHPCAFPHPTKSVSY